MLDQPCSFHTAAGGKPAGHTTRNCSWMTRARRGDGFRQPRPGAPPLSGANVQALPPPPQPRVEKRAPQQDPPWQPDVNHVNHNDNNPAYQSPHQYQQHDEAYLVFLTEPTDQYNLSRRQMEVNVVMPAIQTY